MIEDLIEPYSAAASVVDSIPGVGRQSAIDIIAEIGVDMDAFGRAERLTAWAGLSPRNAESAGKKVHTDHAGNKHLKRALNQCAWGCIHAEGGGRLRGWFWAVARRSGKKKAVVALCHKLLTIIFALLKSGSFFDPA